MSLTIEKLEGGYVVTHHDTRQIATAEHVANFIVRFWPDVAACIQAHLLVEQDSPDHIQNS